MLRNREGTVYLTVRKGRYSFELVVDKATNKKPRVTTEGSVVIALKLVVPNSAFEPIQPAATVVVPEELVQHPVQVEAVDPS